MKEVKVKTDALGDKENVNSAPRALKTLQSTACNKENFAGRIFIDKDFKLASQEHNDHKQEKEDKECQTNVEVTAEDLTSAVPSEHYWKVLAEKTEERLDESLQENERLKGLVESLEEENRICKNMLNESQCLVEVLEEMLGDNLSEDAN